MWWIIILSTCSFFSRDSDFIYVLYFGQTEIVEEFGIILNIILEFARKRDLIILTYMQKNMDKQYHEFNPNAVIRGICVLR